MRTLNLIITFVACMVSANANAEVLKCTASYSSGTNVSISMIVPSESQAKLIVLLGPKSEPTDIGKATGFVSEGVVEYSRLPGTSDQAVLVVTNRQPLIAFFQDPYRIVSLRVDGKAPNAKLAYYDAWFAADEIAHGLCK